MLKIQDREIDVFCTCGNILTHHTTLHDAAYQDTATLTVDRCQLCIQAAIRDVADTEDYEKDTEIEDLEEELRRAESEIKELRRNLGSVGPLGAD